MLQCAGRGEATLPRPRLVRLRPPCPASLLPAQASPALTLGLCVVCPFLSEPSLRLHGCSSPPSVLHCAPASWGLSSCSFSSRTREVFPNPMEALGWLEFLLSHCTFMLEQGSAHGTLRWWLGECQHQGFGHSQDLSSPVLPTSSRGESAQLRLFFSFTPPWKPEAHYYAKTILWNPVLPKVIFFFLL